MSNQLCTDKNMFSSGDAGTLSGMVDGEEQKSLWETALETVSEGVESMFTTTVDTYVQEYQAEQEAELAETRRELLPDAEFTEDGTRVRTFPTAKISNNMILIGAVAIGAIILMRKK
jgi:alpha-galactosidase/6-phospho-beta-glucosidase family protein